MAEEEEEEAEAPKKFRTVARQPDLPTPVLTRKFRNYNNIHVTLISEERGIFFMWVAEGNK